SDGIVGMTISRQQANTRPKDDPLRSRLCIYPSFQSPSLRCRHRQNIGWFPHAHIVTQIDHHCKAITVTLRWYAPLIDRITSSNKYFIQ
ncbi:MAG: hypothetical protein L6425_06255, partial [Candidatus Aminicenantes bacterium]|nr:hypothetical protein [Candidatus Aminicenantes bacterium]